MKTIPTLWLLPLLGGVGWLLASLYHYLTGLNRKITRFLESIRYADFSITFRADNHLGPSFKAVNEEFNAVLEAFRQARAEKEASLHYVQTLVQQVSVGLLTYDTAGRVEVVNQAALRLLGIYRLRSLSELDAAEPGLRPLLEAATTAPTLYKTRTGDELALRVATVRLRERPVRVASLQNIRGELQERELQAWQDLTRVLRHEIMNSLTPIVSLAGTMRNIVEDDLTAPADAEAVADLKAALLLIEQRGEGIMSFVDAYRHFTDLPRPVPTPLAVLPLLEQTARLARSFLPQATVTVSCQPPDLNVMADAALLDRVLLNLVKNAAESLNATSHPTLSLQAERLPPYTAISLSDNGPGIQPEVQEHIFIPFFTTKKSGSGIGLSLSRQIIRQHGGQLTVQSVPGQGSTFKILLGG